MGTNNGSYRVGPVNCPICRVPVARLADLLPHFDSTHPKLTQRERTDYKDKARNEAGWFPKEEKRTWDRGIRMSTLPPEKPPVENSPRERPAGREGGG